MTTGIIRNYKTGADRKVALVKVEGILVRKNFGPDLSVLKEWAPTYKRMEHCIEGHRVLDIGANIGVFAVRALELGAKHVTCCEPEAGALSVLRENVRPLGRRAKVLACAVESKHGTVALYVPSSGNSVSATTSRAVRGRKPVFVDAVPFSAAIEESRATLIKLDCEGAELSFLDGKRIPSSVKVVCGELHREGRGGERRCREILRSFDGWEQIHEPASYSFARCWTVAWRRR